MATQRQFSTMFGLVVAVVLALLVMTAESARTTYSVKRETHSNLGVGSLPQYTSNVVKVGDILHFHYDNKVHDLLEVTYEAFKGCNNSAPLQKWSDGDSDVILSKPGTFYYINGYPGHCYAKHVVIVVDMEPGRADRLASAVATLQTARRQLVSSGTSSTEA